MVGFIGKLVNDIVPKVTIRTFLNQTPWVDHTIRAVLNARTATYIIGFATENMEEYKAASYNICIAVKEAKRHYRRKLESQFRQTVVPAPSIWDQTTKQPPPGVRLRTSFLRKNSTPMHNSRLTLPAPNKPSHLGRESPLRGACSHCLSA